MATQHTQGELKLNPLLVVNEYLCSTPFYELSVKGNIKWMARINEGNLNKEGEGLANAQHILRCWNNFYPMLDALREVSPIIDRWINATPSGEGRNELTDLNIQIKAAINAAEATGAQQPLTAAEADLIIKDKLS